MKYMEIHELQLMKFMPECHIFTSSQNYFSFLTLDFKKKYNLCTCPLSPKGTKIILKGKMKLLNAIHRNHRIIQLGQGSGVF